MASAPLPSVDGLTNDNPALASFLADPSTRARIMREALRLVGTVGIDQLTVVELTRSASVARGTLYANFGDIHGVLAEIWSQLGDQWLADVAAGAPALPHHGAMVQIASVARRSPQLAEVVNPSARRLWDRIATGSASATARAGWLVALRFGIELSRASVDHADYAERYVELVASMPDNAPGPAHPAVTPADVPLPVAESPIDTDTDEITSRLLDAAVEVVASSGLAAASLMRVCRVARLTTGAAAPRFDDLASLHHLAFERATANVAQRNMAQIGPLIATLDWPQVHAAYVVAALGDDRRLWRHYRQELQLGALADPGLADVLRRSFAASDALVAAVFAANGLEPGIVAHGVLFSQLTSIGMPAAANLGLPVVGLDHVAVIDWAYTQLRLGWADHHRWPPLAAPGMGPNHNA